MTFNDLRSILEKRERKCAILDRDYNIQWDKDGFFSSWNNLNLPAKDEFFNKSEIFVSLGTDKARIPICVTKVTFGKELYYICEAFDRATITEIAVKSEISVLLSEYLEGIRNKLQVIQHYASQFTENPLIKSDHDLLWNYKNQAGASLDLLAITTNLEYYFNNFSYADDKSFIDIYSKTSALVKECNKLLKHNTFVLTSKKGESIVKIRDKVYAVMLLNLLQNALLYSKQDSKIELKLFCADEDITVSVTNETENNPALVKNMQLGIGLPLVERIAVSVGGKLMSEHEGNTYRVHVTLPLYESTDSDVVFETSKTELTSEVTRFAQRYLNNFINI